MQLLNSPKERKIILAGLHFEEDDDDGGGAKNAVIRSVIISDLKVTGLVWGGGVTFVFYLLLGRFCNDLDV